GLGGKNGDHRDGMDGGAVAAIFAAALQRSARTHLGIERQAVAAAAQRTGLLGRRRPDGSRLGVTIRESAWDRERRGEEAPRSIAVRVELVTDDGRQESEQPFR